MTLISPAESARHLVVDDLAIPGPQGAGGHWRARVLQLNRPAKRNALTTSLLSELATEIGDAQLDQRVRAIILCGSGGTFCAGGDRSEFAGSAASREGVMARSKLLLDIGLQLERSLVPTLAAVTGPAVGGGAALALSCDMVIATPDVRLGFPEIRSSVVPSLVMPAAIAALGRRLAFDLLTTGRLLDVREAVARGLVNRVSDPADLRQSALDIAAGWASVDTDVVFETKSLLNEMCDVPSDAVRMGLDATARLWQPTD